MNSLFVSVSYNGFRITEQVVEALQRRTQILWSISKHSVEAIGRTSHRLGSCFEGGVIPFEDAVIEQGAPRGLLARTPLSQLITSTPGTLASSALQSGEPFDASAPPPHEQSTAANMSTAAPSEATFGADTAMSESPTAPTRRFEMTFV
jgi:hypothetical protein